MKTLSLISLTILLPAALEFGQNVPRSQTGFDVVSVKRNTYTRGISAPQLLPGGRFVLNGWTLHDMLKSAYAAPGVEVVVANSGWINSDRFDIAARTADGTNAEMSMLQSVLVDRFKVKVHTEMMERDIYVLSPASKDGKPSPQLKVSTCVRSDAARQDGSACNPFRIGAGPTMIAEGMTMPEFAAALANFPVVGRVVQDGTQLSGAFDFQLRWVPGGPSADPNTGPDLFSALRDQLGLKLEGAKGLVSLIVLDHAEPPTEN